MKNYLYLCLAFFSLVTGPSAFAQNVEYGPHPTLEAPSSGIIPTVKIAKAIGWPENKTPVAAQGLRIDNFADGFDHPRWIYVLPNGDILVAETNSPPKPEDSKGIKGMVMGAVMKHAGAGVKTANRITLLRDANGDGKPELRTTFLEGLNSPFGMAVSGHYFYVANTDNIMRYPYVTGDTYIDAQGTKISDLPGGPINHHWTKNIVASPDGKYLYASVGSNSNVGENGIEAEEGRAAIHRINLASGKDEIFATGLRNPNGMDFQPETKSLWTAVNERDELGDTLVPDYMTSVKEGAFYGWPYSYYGQNVDSRMKPQNPELVAKAIEPDYALGAHTASLGLTFYNASLMPQFKNGVFIGQHGSWNRSKPVGYKVIFIPFAKGTPTGLPQDVLTGFLSDKGDAYGRPVGVAVDKTGGLLVADDVGNVIWRVMPEAR
ncbi:MAG: glucose/sorbosone dehydrogenase [Micavibrio sp.]|nr:glucose/sorbosone dehydrogenase [Micavibrio sp.]